MKEQKLSEEQREDWFEVGERVEIVKDNPSSTSLLTGDSVIIDHYDGIFYRVRTNNNQIWYLSEGDFRRMVVFKLHDVVKVREDYDQLGLKAGDAGFVCSISPSTDYGVEFDNGDVLYFSGAELELVEEEPALVQVAGGLSDVLGGV